MKGFDMSMNDTGALRKMILENPELPILIFAGDEAYTGEFSYNQANVNRIMINELTMYGDVWVDMEDLVERLIDNFTDDEEFMKMTDDEFDAAIEAKAQEYEFVETIVIYVG